MPHGAIAVCLYSTNPNVNLFGGQNRAKNPFCSSPFAMNAVFSYEYIARFPSPAGDWRSRPTDAAFIPSRFPAPPALGAGPAGILPGRLLLRMERICGRPFFRGEVQVNRHRFCIVFTVLCALFLAGCARNIVHLSYPSAGEQIPAPTKKSRVCVVDFENLRDKNAIGVRLNGETLLPRTLVERWLALGIAEELGRAGYAVSLAETTADALAEHPDYIVTGEAEEVWIAETSLTRFTGSIRARITLSQGNGLNTTSNSYNSVYSKAVLPVYGVPQTLLGEALSEMLRPAVRLLAQIMP
jgi:hypothetical protein